MPTIISLSILAGIYTLAASYLIETLNGEYGTLTIAQNNLAIAGLIFVIMLFVLCMKSLHDFVLKG